MLVMTNAFSIRTVKFRNLVASYRAYFNALRENEKNWTQIQLETPQEMPRLTIRRVLTFHLVRILFARLHAVARTGLIFALFQTRWDPIILEVRVDYKLVGYCFMERQSAEVFQVSMIASVGQEREKWAERDILFAAKKYLKTIGASRIFVRSSNKEMKIVLKMCDFKSAFQDNILYLDL